MSLSSVFMTIKINTNIFKSDESDIKSSASCWVSTLDNLFEERKLLVTQLSVKMHLLLKYCQDIKETLVLKLFKLVHQVSQDPETDHSSFVNSRFHICLSTVPELYMCLLFLYSIY